jgi:hypothetical protein
MRPGLRILAGVFGMSALALLFFALGSAPSTSAQDGIGCNFNTSGLSAQTIDMLEARCGVNALDDDADEGGMGGALDDEDEDEGGMGGALDDEDEDEGTGTPGDGTGDEDEDEGTGTPGDGTGDEDEDEGTGTPGDGTGDEDEDEGTGTPGDGTGTSDEDDEDEALVDAINDEDEDEDESDLVAVSSSGEAQGGGTTSVIGGSVFGQEAQGGGTTSVIPPTSAVLSAQAVTPPATGDAGLVKSESSGGSLAYGFVAAIAAIGAATLLASYRRLAKS